MTTRARQLVIINPGNRKRVYQGLGAGLAAIEPPVWAGLIAKFIRDRGHGVQLIDSNAEGLSPQETAQRAADANPWLTAVVVYGHQPSASTQNMPAAREICRAIKELDSSARVILVGGHVSALPERTLREEVADFACQGEGPHTLLALLETDSLDDTSGVSAVPGLWYREGSDLRSTLPAPLIKDVDADLGGMAWELYPMDLYRAHNWHCFGQPSREPYASVYTSFGCPFHCTFCCINAPFGGPGYRMRSPSNVLDEIGLLVEKYDVRNIKIADELFVLNMKHVRGICDGIIERGYDLNIWAYARVDITAEPELLATMRSAGITWLALGIESGNQDVLDDARKETVRGDTIAAVRAIEKADISVIGNYIFGLPEDTIESMGDTLGLAKELNCDFGNFYCAMAYPGSKLYDMAVDMNWPLPESWGGYSQHAYDALPLPTNHLDSSAVLRFRDSAFIDYYEDPAYQRKLQDKFGDKALAEVREMLKKKLERKYA